MWSPLQKKTVGALITRSVILKSGCRNKLANENSIPSSDVAIMGRGALVSSGVPVRGGGWGENSLNLGHRNFLCVSCLSGWWIETWFCLFWLSSWGRESAVVKAVVQEGSLTWHFAPDISQHKTVCCSGSMWGEYEQTEQGLSVYKVWTHI